MKRIRIKEKQVDQVIYGLVNDVIAAVFLLFIFFVVAPFKEIKSFFRG